MMVDCSLCRNDPAKWTAIDQQIAKSPELRRKLERREKQESALRGCREDLPEPYRPDIFARFDVELRQCPSRVLREAPPETGAIWQVYNDRQAGCCPGWPDMYAAGIVQGVRLIESIARQREVEQIRDIRRRQRDAETKGGRRR